MNKTRNRLWFAVIFISCVLTADGNTCTHVRTCNECIGHDVQCAWCKQDNYDQSPRCDLTDNLPPKCAKEHIIDPPKFGRRTTLRDAALTGPRDTTNETVQITPQHISLKLRPGFPFDLTVSFRQVDDFPIDVYYLMDLSISPEHKDKLARLGELLATRINSITSDFRLGFGSFVDKVAMPYVDTVPEKLRQPCSKCAPPYGFKNNMPLSSDLKKFTQNVAAAKLSGNLDEPEGTFDAIMQSIVCEREIGWRQQSRKILVVATDSGFHYAGDGKLGGIVEPNDGRCHLDHNGMYTESTRMDYPSMDQLIDKVQEKKVSIIFAVTADQLSLYERLSRNLEGSMTAELDDDSSDVLELIRNQYDKITSTVALTDTARSEFVQLNYHSRCLNPNSEKNENTNTCRGLKAGTTVDFWVEIKVKKCPADPRDWKQKFSIYPVGISEDLSVDLEMICECDGQRPENSTEEVENRREEDETPCLAPGSTIVCSGRGQCISGQCDCFTHKRGWESVYGTYCECNDLSCDRHRNLMCNGHGDCDCGICKCHNGWMGSACECPSVNEMCIAPGQNVVCSGFGDCVCGRCLCKQDHVGRYCEECPTCPVPRWRI